MLEDKGLYNKKLVPKTDKDAEAKDEDHGWVFDYGWQEKWNLARNPFESSSYDGETEESIKQQKKKELLDKILGGHSFD
jgi:hypothetical protein